MADWLLRSTWRAGAVAAAVLLAACAAERERITSAAPGEVAAIVEEPWDFLGIAGTRLTTSHYRLHTTSPVSWMQNYAINFAEEALAHYTSVLAPLPPPGRMLDVYLFAERSEWRDHTRELMKDHAALYLNLGRGGYSTRGTAVLYDIGFEDTFAILSHEGWHQYTQVTFEHPLPTWLEEGLATYMEGRRQVPGTPVEFLPSLNPQRLAALRQAHERDRMFTLAVLIDRSPQHFLESSSRDLLTYYAQVWVMAHFLMNGEDGRYREGVARLLHDAVEGRIVSTILTKLDAPLARRRRMAVSNFGPGIILAYFNPDFSQFAEQYDAFLEHIIEHGAPDGPIPAIR